MRIVIKKVFICHSSIFRKVLHVYPIFWQANTFSAIPNKLAISYIHVKSRSVHKKSEKYRAIRCRVLKYHE